MSDMATTTADTLDDIFGSGPEPTSIPAPAGPTGPADSISDIPALRRRHVTNGYREGISESKGNYIQEGFDAGFPIGAQLGMRAGTVLGILEGLVRGFESSSSSGVIKKQRPKQGKDDNRKGEELDQRRREKRERILKVYRSAVKELAVEGVFAGLEGNKIKGDGGDVLDEEVKEKKDPREELTKKGDATISVWEKRVSVARWEENMDTLEAKDDAGEAQPGSGAGPAGSKGTTQAVEQS